MCYNLYAACCSRHRREATIAMWIIFAIMSAFFAGVTSILSKCGIKKTDSDLATALRTGVVLVFSIICVFVVGSQGTLTDISLKSLVFLVLSGIATGASWICYFKALSKGDVNKVVPIDKSSTPITVLLAVICFGETSNLVLKLVGALVMTLGIYLMVEKKENKNEKTRSSWLLWAVLSALFASATSILAKIGIENVESNLATALRTLVVLVMAWVIVFAKDKQKGLRQIDRRELLYILLSGVSTGASWLCYYRAIADGIVSVVVPIDKLSILVTVTLSYFVFGEKLSKKGIVGLLLMVVGTLVIAFFK